MGAGVPVEAGDRRRTAVLMQHQPAVDLGGDARVLPYALHLEGGHPGSAALHGMAHFDLDSRRRTAPPGGGRRRRAHLRRQLRPRGQDELGPQLPGPAPQGGDDRSLRRVHAGGRQVPTHLRQRPAQRQEEEGHSHHPRPGCEGRSRRRTVSPARADAPTQGPEGQPRPQERHETRHGQAPAHSGGPGQDRQARRPAAIDPLPRQPLRVGEGARQVADEDGVAVPGLVEDLVAEGAGRGQHQQLTRPRVLRGEQDHQVLLGHGPVLGQILQAELALRQRPHPGVLGGGGRHVGAVPGGGRSARVDAQGTGGGEAQAAARRGPEGAEVAEGGQVAQVEGGLHLALHPVHGDRHRAGVAVHDQVRHRLQAERLQETFPGAPHPLDAEADLALLAGGVAHPVGAAGQDGGASRGEEAAQLGDVLPRHPPRFQPEQDVHVARDEAAGVDVDLEDGAVLAQVAGEAPVARGRRHGEGRLGRRLARRQARRHQAGQVRQVGVLDPLDEDVLPPGAPLPGEHQGGPDLRLALGVVDDAAHPDGTRAAGGGVAGARRPGEAGIDDAVAEAPAGGLLHLLEQGPGRGLHLLQVGGHALPAADEEGGRQLAVEAAQDPPQLGRHRGRMAAAEIEMDGRPRGAQQPPRVDRDPEEEDGGEEGLDQEGSLQCGLVST